MQTKQKYHNKRESRYDGGGGESDEECKPVFQEAEQNKIMFSERNGEYRLW